jgi:AraC-like DNA-binding protein
MNQISFSLPQILALIGLVQCLYVIGFMMLRSRALRHGTLPLLYFGVLALAFGVDLGAAHIPLEPRFIFFIQWALWFLGPPLSVLLVIQLSDITKPPSWADAWVLLLLPFSFLLSTLAATNIGLCSPGELCPELRQLLSVTGLIPGTISLLVIFSKKDLLTDLPRQKYGHARYWLVIALIVLNACLLIAALLNVMGHIDERDLLALRSLLGLGFVYSASTLLLRIFPAPGKTSAVSESALDEKERILATRIESLLDLEKVYQEPTYSRMDLARECEAPEAAISKVINLHFGKSFPQLINERRIDDAKRLLRETSAPIAQIASEVGFNSLPSFNRVFKEFENQSPSSYRKGL